ncbi:MAG TPA: hypothetical protein VK348_03930, partial [Planctomycetota bacterium]|nr:hypothetical protein [Planctomycetota bacterium]
GMHVRLVDDGGAPVQPNEVYLYVYDGAPPHVRNDEMIGFDYGVAQLVVAGREFDVLLLGREVRPQKWRGPAADTDLHVQLPFVVTLRFRDLPTVADGNAVLAKLQRHQDVAGLAATLGLPAEFTMASIAEDTMVVVAGVVQFRVNEAGTYDVAVSCHDAQIEDISSNPGRPIGHWTVTVVRAADCEFTLHVPAAGK